jgi:hypothetical protein
MENFLHLYRQGRGADIPVMGLQPQNGIPDTAADCVRRKAGTVKTGQQVGDGGGKDKLIIHNSKFIIQNYIVETIIPESKYIIAL